MTTPDRAIKLPTSAARASRLVKTPPSTQKTPPSAVTPPVETLKAPKTTRINAQVPVATRDRAHAAYRLANYKEGTISFSAFITGAIEREIVRLEKEHNNGEPLSGDPAPMRTGRPPGQ